MTFYTRLSDDEYLAKLTEAVTLMQHTVVSIEAPVRREQYDRTREKLKTIAARRTS